MTLFNFNGVFDTERFKTDMNNFCKEFSSTYNEYFILNPRSDVYEDEKNFYIDVELPGLSKEEISIKYENYLLTISGEKKNPVKENMKLFRQERRYGKFQRKFSLTKDADSSNIEAQFENGVLTVVIPKLNQKTTDEKNINIK